MDNSTQSLTIRRVENRADFDRFLRLPLQLYDGHKGFSCPLEFERREVHDPKKAPFFEHGRAQGFLALRGDRVIGRISAQYDTLAVQTYGQNLGFFGFLDCADDAEAVRALLGAAENWVLAQGAVAIRGPFSHSINEEIGLMIEGADRRPVLLMPYHPPYLAKLVESAGYAKVMDVDAFDYVVGRAGIRRRAESAASEDVVIRTINMKNYDAEIAAVVAIFNDAWARNWGFVPFTRAEMTHMAQSLKAILAPELVVFAEIRGETVAMAVCLPNIAEIVQDFKGKLLPFNWVHLLRQLQPQGVKSARVPLMGLMQKYQNTLEGMSALLGMFAYLDASMMKRGILNVELSWILENNDSMRRLLRVLGAEPYKKYRIYDKNLVIIAGQGDRMMNQDAIA